jgi:hypothetical protein
MVTSAKISSSEITADKSAPKKTAATKLAAAKKVVAAPAKAVVKTSVQAAAKSTPTPASAKPAAKSVGAPKTKLKASTAPKPVLSTEQRNHYVSVAAFYIAERRGFTLGNPANDWLAAEAEVDRLIASGHFTV